MNVSSTSIALRALGLALFGCGTRTALFAGSQSAPLFDAGSPMELLDGGSLGEPSATSLDASGDAPRVAVKSCPVGFPKREVQPFDKSCRNSLDCEYGVLPGCCSSYAISYTRGQKAIFGAWAMSWKDCIAAACGLVDCAGDGTSFENGEVIRGLGDASSVGVECQTQGGSPSCVTYPNALPAANSSGQCGRNLWDSPGLVCFGSDPAPYQKYLPSDAGIAVGRCPMERDFPRNVGEGSCAFLACGPLVPSIVFGLRDAGSQTSPAGASCCFWLNHICGV
ncbi:MAG TPA: hypothetical protein VGY54_09135 [Polyangiaceae bacterium]|nr:hypothetical protein [Polyangiaceae bacterium]